MYTIEKQFISGVPTRPLNAKNIIVAHESGNPNNTGANSLQAEINYMKNNWNKGAKAWVSHWVGGGGRIVQLAPTGIRQNGAGGQANRVAYAHVELARTNNKRTFEKDYKAYVWLLRRLADEAGIPKTLDTKNKKGIKSHDWVRRNLGGTTHTDPYGYLASFGISKAKFKSDVENGIRESGKVNESHSVSKPTAANVNNSIVDYLKSKGMPSGYNYRKKLASRNGIKNYRGTADQNKLLLDKLKGNVKKFNLPTRVLKLKKPQMYGKDVMEYQAALASIYFYPEKGAKNNGVDGYFGKKTADCTKRFQSYYGLVVDGNAGPDTMRKLDSLVNR